MQLSTERGRRLGSLVQCPRRSQALSHIRRALQATMARVTPLTTWASPLLPRIQKTRVWSRPHLPALSVPKMQFTGYFFQGRTNSDGLLGVNPTPTGHLLGGIDLTGSYQSRISMLVDREPAYRGGARRHSAGCSTGSEHDPNHVPTSTVCDISPQEGWNRISRGRLVLCRHAPIGGCPRPQCHRG